MHRIAMVAILIGLLAQLGLAGMFEEKALSINFTDSADARAKATWSEPDKLSITSGGLGWEGEAGSYRDGWLQTVPLAIGWSWRPTDGASFRVSIHPRPVEVVLPDGLKTTPGVGSVYVRYSPDLKHWSTWQLLQRNEPQSVSQEKNPGRNFSGAIGVPRTERDPYSKLLMEYSQLDVPWKSDEEAAVHWILKSDPDFFAKHLPFVGYVQFLYEGLFYPGQRITSFRAEVSYGAGGLHSWPKDQSVYSKHGDKPWSFRANKPEAGPSQEPDRERVAAPVAK